MTSDQVCSFGKQTNEATTCISGKLKRTKKADNLKRANLRQSVDKLD